ncbi:MAG: hypothetical protein WKF43_17640 [Acidimicrobiales bacterium]
MTEPGLAVDSEALVWLQALLAPDAQGGDGGGPVGRSDERWAVLPSARRPRVLVPLGARRAAAAMLARDSGFGARGRRLLGLAFRFGVTPAGLGGRMLVPAGHSFTPWIAELLDEPNLVTGLTIGPPRPNRKPVVQLIRPDGTTAAWAKVSCTPLTTALVTNEGDWLERIERAGPRTPAGRTIEAPRVLARVRWHDLDVLVIAPLPERTRTAKVFAPDADLLQTIAGLGETTSRWVPRSPWWTALHQRAVAVTDAYGREVLDGALAAIGERLAPVTWRFGAWHGDLTFWNTRTCGPITQIWDWERAAGQRPVGFDAAHASFQAAQVGQGLGVSRAAAAADQAVAPVLADLDLDPAHSADLVTCYLRERWLRWDEDARLGSGTVSSDRHAAILAAIGKRHQRGPVA